MIQKVLDELIQYAYVVTALCLKMNISFNLIYVHISRSLDSGLICNIQWPGLIGTTGWSLPFSQLNINWMVWKFSEQLFRPVYILDKLWIVNNTCISAIMVG